MVKGGLALMWVNALQGSEVRIHMDAKQFFLFINFYTPANF